MRKSSTVRAARALLGGAAPALVLAACAAQPDGAGGTRTVSVGEPVRLDAAPQPGGVIATGASITSMSAQYALPNTGRVATGASAWVEPAPAPAFIATGPMPAADPPPPPLAAVANRQPSDPPGRPESDAAGLVRPEAAVPQPSQATQPDPAARTRGLALFNQFSCGTCHVLADAGASGAIGPSLDRNPRLTRAFAIDVISDGRGAMPAFAGLMSDAEIAALADYIVAVARD